MSKLYDVISRLEDVAEQDSESLDTPFPEFEEKPQKAQSPMLRIVLFSLLFIVLGALAVALTAWWQNWFAKQDIDLFKKNLPAHQQQRLHPIGDSPSQTSPVSNVNTMASSPDTSIPKKPQEVTAKNYAVTIPDELLRTTMIDDVGGMDRTVETIDDLLNTPMDAQINAQPDPPETTPLKKVRIYVHDLDIAEAVIEEEFPSLEESFPTSQSTHINATKAKTSRWLHQAELYRHHGEWEGAIALYQRVWDITREPDVANNLAAALIQVNRLEEALTILHEASIIAPKDPDIKENLETVEQLLTSAHGK